MGLSKYCSTSKSALAKLVGNELRYHHHQGFTDGPDLACGVRDDTWVRMQKLARTSLQAESWHSRRIKDLILKALEFSTTKQFADLRIQSKMSLLNDELQVTLVVETSPGIKNFPSTYTPLVAVSYSIPVITWRFGEGDGLCVPSTPTLTDVRTTSIKTGQDVSVAINDWFSDLFGALSTHKCDQNWEQYRHLGVLNLVFTACHRLSAQISSTEGFCPAENHSASIQVDSSQPGLATDLPWSSDVSPSQYVFPVVRFKRGENIVTLSLTLVEGGEKGKWELVRGTERLEVSPIIS